MLTLFPRRLIDAAVVVWPVGTLSFTLLPLAPGDPLTSTLTDPRLSADVRTQWRRTYAPDQPIPAPYLRYASAIARGDLGYSFSQYRPVKDVLLESLPNSLLLMGLTLTLSVALGLGFGIRAPASIRSWIGPALHWRPRHLAVCFAKPMA